MEIYCYEDFLRQLSIAGFCMSGGNSRGIYTIIPWGWKQEPPYPTPVQWHTEDPETDPWEWRIRVLNEGREIAYAKLFCKCSGYITKAWYPYFLAARRKPGAYPGLSEEADRIYSLISDNISMPAHVIKELGGFGKSDKAAFERAMLLLQEKLYITMCGNTRKRTRLGEEYGWSSSVFCTTEEFWGSQVFDQAAGLKQSEAVNKITEQIYRLNPLAKPGDIKKFIG